MPARAPRSKARLQLPHGLPLSSAVPPAPEPLPFPVPARTEPQGRASTSPRGGRRSAGSLRPAPRAQLALPRSPDANRSDPGPVPTAGIRSRSRTTNCHRAPGQAKPCPGRSILARLGCQDVPLHPVGAARVVDKPLRGVLGEILAPRDAIADLCAGEALASHKPSSSRTRCWSVSQTFSLSREGAGWACWEQSQPPRPGQVLCTLPRPPCQRKRKHPTQRKHFSSATQVPIFARGRAVLGSFPHRTAGLSESPAKLSGLGFGQSRPSHRNQST